MPKSTYRSNPFLLIESKLKKLLTTTKTALILVFFAFFIPRVIGLGADMANIDTMYWYPRIDDFPRELLEGDFKGTYQQYHPGTTLLWASGFSKYFFEMAYESKYGFKPSIYPHHFIKINFVSTLPLVVMISLLATFCYYVIAKLTNKKLAIAFLITLSLEPFFLGISRFLHLTALSIMFGFSAYLAMLYFVKNFDYKVNKKLIFNKWLLLSGILQGLAISTKISILIVHPIIAITLLYFGLISTSKFLVRIKNITILATTAIFHLLIVCITFVTINPYMWVAPMWGINKIYKQGIVDTGFGGGMPDTLLDSQYLYYLETAFVRTTPLIFLLFIIGIVWFLKNFKKEYKNHLLVGGLIFFVVYYLFLSIPSKLKDRYFVELMPAMFIFVAYAIYQILSKIKKRKIQLTLVLAFFTITSYNLYSYYPAFSFYHTDLLGGANGYYTYFKVRPTNRGEWYAQAAQYLNKIDKKPEHKNVLMGNESLIKTFSQFYFGTTYAELGAIPDNKGYKVDYIITRNENQKYVPVDVCPLHKGFGNRGFFAFQNVFIFKCNNVLKDDLTKMIPTFPDY